MPARTVLFVAFDGVSALDISGPLSVFAGASHFLQARPQGGGAAYSCHIVTLTGGAVASDLGTAFLSAPVQEFESVDIDTIMVPGAVSMEGAVADRALVAWLAEHGPAARRICSVCAGTYLLAEAGLLDSRRAVTHWAHVAALRARYPKVAVECDPIFVRDDPVWSSAGVTAGIDLALALVEDDHDRELAMQVARQHVVFLKRPGGQSQFSVLLEAQSLESETFGALHEWLLTRLGDRRLTVEQMAEQAGMSPRNFARVYRAKTGRTPAKTIELFRLEAARRLLEETDERIEQVARRTGFGDDERMRTTFQRHLNVSPRQYRERFGRQQPALSHVGMQSH